MKRTFPILFLLLLMTMVGCNGLDRFTEFDFERTTSITVPAAATMDLPFNLNSPDVENDSEGDFSSNGTESGLIEEITVKQIEMTITAPAGEDFSFLEKIYLYISADGLPEVEIGSLDPVPGEAAAVINLSTTETDLQEYLKKGLFKLRMNTTTDEVLTQNINIDIRTVFHVNARIFGV